jgi:hypothetical protein
MDVYLERAQFRTARMYESVDPQRTRPQERKKIIDVA